MLKSHHMLLRRAFTLIELLIVIAIIGILAVAFLPALTAGPKKARDKARISTVNDLVSAIEARALDGNGYPNVGGDYCVNFSAGAGQLLAQEIKKVPPDYRSSVSPLYLCAPPGYKSAFYLKTLPGGDDGNYLIAAQMELTESGNVDTDIVDGPGSGSQIVSIPDVKSALKYLDGPPKKSGTSYYLVVK